MTAHQLFHGKRAFKLPSRQRTFYAESHQLLSARVYNPEKRDFREKSILFFRNNLKAENRNPITQINSSVHSADKDRVVPNID